MASPNALPEPMNSQPNHSKVKVTITLPDPTFVAGNHVSGKLEMECRADKGLGLGIMMIELFAVQELSSRDHSATSTFLHSRRLFQGPGLPPSNAVEAYPQPGDPPLPPDYHQARKGRSTFLFRIPLPATSPPSLVFGTGLAKVRYELRASVGVFWKNERRLVVDKQAIDVVAALPYDVVPPEGIVVGENGKLWMQGKVVGLNIVSGSPACVELQVKNHSTKKNTGLTVSLTRTLYLPGATAAPLQISDSLTVVPFRGPEYIIPPGAEGIANLVFDVPKQARGVSSGLLDGEEAENGTGLRRTESLFEIRCKIEVKLTMGVGSKDIVLEIPVEVVHPLALPLPQEATGPYYTPTGAIPAQVALYPEYVPHYPPASPVHAFPYMDPIHNQVWFPPPPIPHQPLASYPYQSDVYSQPQAYPASPHAYFDPGQVSPSPGPFAAVAAHPLISAPQLGVPAYIQRPSSAGPVFAASEIPAPMIPGLPVGLPQQSLLPLQHPPLHESGGQHRVQEIVSVPTGQHIYPQPESQEGKGERASRITHHLRMLSRNRSVSPQSHRYPLPVPPPTQNVPLFSNEQTMGVPLQPFQPPVVSPTTPLAPRAKETAVVYSPRPQLTPKTSFSRDPVLGMTRTKSERVDELEKMADEVAKESTDLSADLPRGAGEKVLAKDSPKAKKAIGDITNEQLNMNKTLPGPPVPSGKHMVVLPTRPRADLYFDGGPPLVPETQPLPSDQAPPTPALVALPSRQRSQRDELRTEGGLDALERRLLAEVGTRKVDTRHFGKDRRPDVRNVLPINTSIPTTAPIAIPSKSPEPLDDSAISSLTLAGGLAGGEDSDGEFDGKTHKAGGSGSGGRLSVGRQGGLHQRMRARAQQVSTPTRTLAMERERAREAGEGIFGEMDWSSNFGGPSQEPEQSRMAPVAQPAGKKPKNNKSVAAKGRVAAWLGCIDPDVPPQEQIIPPSPSVLRHSEAELAYDNGMPMPLTSQAVPPPDRDSKTPGPESRQTQPTEVDASPNPRSSGFVPISALKRSSIDAQPRLLSTVNSVVQEARRVQDLWSSATIQGNSNGGESEKNLYSGVPSPAPIPDSSKAGIKPSLPFSYSAAARNVRKSLESNKIAAPAKASAAPPLPRDKVRALFPPSSHKAIEPETKYDIRSARGGRGGKVTQVANLWASGAINSNPGVKKDSEVRPNHAIVEKKLPPPPPPPQEKMLFSAALKAPSPRRKQPAAPAPPTSSGAAQVKPLDDAQKRPDSRALFQPANVQAPLIPPVSKRSGSSAALSTPASGSVPPITKESFAAAQQRRPSTSMSFNSRQTAPLAANPPAMPATKMTKAQFGVGAKAPKPGVIKATSDPAVVSSSHAVPMLSTTASLARPHAATSATSVPPIPRPAMLSTTLTSSKPNLNASSQVSGPPRAPSPTKPVDLAFGQARLRDLIKKYQGNGQKT